MKNSPKCLQLLLIWCDINACCLTVFPLTLITELLWLTMPSARPSDIFLLEFTDTCELMMHYCDAIGNFMFGKGTKQQESPLYCSWRRSQNAVIGGHVSLYQKLIYPFVLSQHVLVPGCQIPLFCQKLLGLKRYTRSVLWPQGLDVLVRAFFECSELKVLFERATDSCHPSYLRKSDLGLF